LVLLAIALWLLAACGGSTPAPDGSAQAPATAALPTLEPTADSDAEPSAVPTVEPQAEQPTEPIATPIPTSEPLPAPTTAVIDRPIDEGEPVFVEPIVLPTYQRVLQIQDAILEGDDVYAVQARLIALGYFQVGEIDGLYGPQSAEAVRAFQGDNGLEADGIVGPQTWEALFAADVAAAPGSGPLIPLIDTNDHWLIGAIRDGRWIPAYGVGPFLQLGEPLTIYYPDLSQEQTSIQTFGSIGIPCESTVLVNPEQPAALGLAVGAGLDPRPRPIQAGSETDAIRAAIAGLLRDQGLPGDLITITNIIEADVDNDGTSEAIVAATNLDMNEGGFPQPQAAAGNYSLIALVRAGEPALLIDGFFYPTFDETRIGIKLELIDLLDLNGDGTLDIFASSQYYEGSSSYVYDLSGSRPEIVIGSGCGV
jgi:hypothetical protein